jgi:ABC-type cobalamin/Fe3+-siderophores transport system ATPase subunit
MIVVVYGPKGCGKTTLAEALRDYFGCGRIIDNWDGERIDPQGDPLVLTRGTLEQVRKAQPLAKHYAFADVRPKFKNVEIKRAGAAQ